MTDDEIVALERAGWDALSSTQGVGYYREHLADSALLAFPFGVLDREQALQAIASAPPWSRYDLTDVRVLRIGEDVALVVYAVEAAREGQPDFNAIVSSTFVREKSTWRLAFHQQSPRS